MTQPPIGLGELLASGSANGSGGALTPTRAPEGVSFEEMLALAREGRLTSGIPVTVSPSVDVELSDDQLARLSSAADRAESAGLSRVVVALDDQMLVLDIDSRSIVDRFDPAGVEPLGGIDGILSAGAAAGQTPAPIGAGGAPISNPSLLSALAQRLVG